MQLVNCIGCEFYRKLHKNYVLITINAQNAPFIPFTGSFTSKSVQVLYILYIGTALSYFVELNFRVKIK